MKQLIAALGVLVALVVGFPATSTAGGWVGVSLDAVPELRSGEAVDVGFTVLRHGVTPESSDDLSVVLTDARGEVHRFEATQQGAAGHHVTTIDVPIAGSYTWKVTGAFVAADLGRVEVSAAGSGGGVGWSWDVAQWGSLALAVALGGLAGRDALRQRRPNPADAVAA